MNSFQNRPHYLKSQVQSDLYFISSNLLTWLKERVCDRADECDNGEIELTQVNPKQKVDQTVVAVGRTG
jgi:hypothetical protein